MTKESAQSRRPSMSVELLVYGVIVLVLGIPAYGEKIYVGDQEFKIPAPEGFVGLGEAREELMPGFEATTPEMRTLRAVFITKDDFDLWSQNKLRKLNEYFFVQTVDVLDDIDLRMYEFASHKEKIRSETPTAHKIYAEEIRAFSQEIAIAESERLEAQVKLDTKDVKFLEVHDESATHISFSGVGRIEKDINGTTEEGISVGTMSDVLLNGKVLILSSYRPSQSEYEEDLKITRERISRWLPQVVAANTIVWPTDDTGFVLPDTILEPELAIQLKGEFVVANLKSLLPAQDISGSFQYPSKWILDEERSTEDFVALRASPNTFGTNVACLIGRDELPEWAIAFLTATSGQALLSQVKKVYADRGYNEISAGITSIDSKPAVWTKCDKVTETKEYRSVAEFRILHEGKSVFVTCIVYGPHAELPLLQHGFDSYLPVFQVIAESIRLDTR